MFALRDSGWFNPCIQQLTLWVLQVADEVCLNLLITAHIYSMSKNRQISLVRITVEIAWWQP